MAFHPSHSFYLAPETTSITAGTHIFDITNARHRNYRTCAPPVLTVCKSRWYSKGYTIFGSDGQRQLGTWTPAFSSQSDSALRLSLAAGAAATNGSGGRRKSGSISTSKSRAGSLGAPGDGPAVDVAVRSVVPGDLWRDLAESFEFGGALYVWRTDVDKAWALELFAVVGSGAQELFIGRFVAAAASSAAAAAARRGARLDEDFFIEGGVLQVDARGIDPLVAALTCVTCLRKERQRIEERKIANF